jgi:hypothetical protein
MAVTVVAAGVVEAAAPVVGARVCASTGALEIRTSASVATGRDDGMIAR